MPANRFTRPRPLVPPITPENAQQISALWLNAQSRQSQAVPTQPQSVATTLSWAGFIALITAARERFVMSPPLPAQESETLRAALVALRGLPHGDAVILTVVNPELQSVPVAPPPRPQPYQPPHPRRRAWRQGDPGYDPVLARFPDLQDEEPEDL